MKRRAVQIGLVVMVVLVVAGLLAWVEPWNRGGRASAPPQAATQDSEDGGSQGGDEPGVGVERVVETKRKISKRERERYEQAIRDAPGRRAQAAAQREGPSSTDLPLEDDDREPSHDPGSGGLTDRSDGKLAGLLQDLQDDVMPLADECYELALERDPTLQGGLDLQFEVVGDEDVGGLVDSVELLETSELQDEEMITCMRETLLSTIFPAPEGSGSTGVQLTLRFSPDEVE